MHPAKGMVLAVVTMFKQVTSDTQVVGLISSRIQTRRCASLAYAGARAQNHLPWSWLEEALHRQLLGLPVANKPDVGCLSRVQSCKAPAHDVRQG